MGTLSNELDNLIRWIVVPQVIEPGIATPDVDINETVACAMAAYLYTLAE